MYQFLETEGSTRRIYVKDEEECKRFMRAVLWIVRSDAQWRLLPKEYGSWNAVYKRFAKWSRAGVFNRMFEHFRDDPDLAALIIDFTVVRAHACAAGASKKK